MNTKLFAVLLFVAGSQAAPAADAEADPQYLAHAAAPVLAPAAYHAPAPNCVTENEILTTQSCTPTVENVCSKQVVETEEIEYEKVCKDVVDVLCDAPAVAAAPVAVAAAAPVAVAAPAAVVAAAPAAAVVKREAEAEAEADAQFYGYAPYAHAAVAAPVAHAVAHSAVATVKHSCREVTTQHCVDNPVVKLVPVEVENCHAVTKVACAPVDNPIPKTTCTPVETQHVASYALPHIYHK